MNQMRNNLVSRTSRILASALALALTFPVISINAIAQPPLVVKEDAAQLKADQAALQRQLKRLQSDEARLRSDTISGRMSAESKDAYAIYTTKQAIVGEAKDIAADNGSALQMKADEAALERQIKRLDAAMATGRADTEEGKMAAVSPDTAIINMDRQATNAERKNIAIDAARLKTAKMN